MIIQTRVFPQTTNFVSKYLHAYLLAVAILWYSPNKNKSACSYLPYNYHPRFRLTNSDPRIILGALCAKESTSATSVCTAQRPRKGIQSAT